MGPSSPLDTPFGPDLSRGIAASALALVPMVEPGPSDLCVFEEMGFEVQKRGRRRGTGEGCDRVLDRRRTLALAKETPA